MLDTCIHFAKSEQCPALVFGFHAFFDWQRPEAPGPQLLAEPVQEPLHAHLLLDVAGGLPVHAG